MAAQYVSDQQGYPPPGKAAYPPQAAEQGDQYAQLSQVYSPPCYDYMPRSYDYKPQPVASDTTTVVVGAQPTATITTVSPPREGHKRLAAGALIFSAVLLFCGTSFIGLFCAIPAFILAIVAMESKGSKQKTLAGTSIGLNVASIVCTVLFLVVVIPVYAVYIGRSSSSSTSYYRGYYRTYFPTYHYSYYTYYYRYRG